VKEARHSLLLFSRDRAGEVRSSAVVAITIMAAKVHPELLRQFPTFAAALNEFTLFLEAAEADLAGKRERLTEQRKLLSETRKKKKAARAKRSTTAKNYVDCQIFMLNRHARRLLLFKSETEGRLGEAGKAVDDSNGSVGEDARQMVHQLHSDLAKMKRRCKHILDVTDRYCVLTRTDLKLERDDDGQEREGGHDEEDGQNRPPSQNRSLGGQSNHSSSSEDSVDGASMSSCEIDEAGSVASCPAAVGSDAGPLPPVSPISRHMVRSTLESFGSHLRVIAKTYTKRRGTSLSTVPEVEGIKA